MVAKIKNRAALEVLARALAAKRAEAGYVIKVCMGNGCLAVGAEDVFRAFKVEIERQGVAAKVIHTGCQGFCQGAPLITVEPRGLLLHRVTPFDVPKIVDIVVKRGGELIRHFYHDPETGMVCRRAQEMPFYRDQVKVAMRNVGVINPVD